MSIDSAISKMIYYRDSKYNEAVEYKRCIMDKYSKKTKMWKEAKQLVDSRIAEAEEFNQIALMLDELKQMKGGDA